MFKCPIMLIDISTRCRVRSCMWSSATNRTGCMASAGIPEGNQITVETVARHKGVSTADALQEREISTQRIESCMVLYNLLEWYSFQYSGPLPWPEAVCDGAVHGAVNGWCAARWPFTVRELGWTTGTVALTVYQPVLTRFEQHIGQRINWLTVLEFKRSDVQQLSSIFINHKGAT